MMHQRASLTRFVAFGFAGLGILRSPEWTSSFVTRKQSDARSADVRRGRLRRSGARGSAGPAEARARRRLRSYAPAMLHHDKGWIRWVAPEGRSLGRERPVQHLARVHVHRAVEVTAVGARVRLPGVLAIREGERPVGEQRPAHHRQRLTLERARGRVVAGPDRPARGRPSRHQPGRILLCRRPSRPRRDYSSGRTRRS